MFFNVRWWMWMLEPTCEDNANHRKVVGKIRWADSNRVGIGTKKKRRKLSNIY